MAAKGAPALRILRRTTCIIQNGRQGASKWPTGSGKVSITKFFGHSKQLSLNKFFDPSTPSRSRRKNKRKEKRKENNDVYSGH